MAEISADAAVRPVVPGFLGLGRAASRLVSEDGLGDPEVARRAIAEYERFFLLAASRGHGDADDGSPLAPSSRVDVVWRRHMLDTRSYAGACLRWAGAYLHRVEGTPPGSFERCVAALDASGREEWARPGPAHVRRGTIPPPGRRPPRGAAPLESEDLAGLVAGVRDAGARRLVESDPGLAEGEYRRFLGLLIAGEGPLTPCKLVDEIWHRHILDSEAYASFCERVAGGYIHHDPSYGRPLRVHAIRFERARAAYRRRFRAEPPGEIWARMGDSEGGGGSDCTPPPPPLHALVDLPNHLNVHACLFKAVESLDERLHPVLPLMGLPRGLWREFLDTIDATPRVGPEEFLREDGPGTLAVAIAGGAFATPIFYTLMGFARWYGASPAGLVIYASLWACVAVGVLQMQWEHRDLDRDELERRMARFAPVLAERGVKVEIRDLAAIKEAEAGDPDGRGAEDCEFYRRLARKYVLAVEARFPLPELARRRRAATRRLRDDEADEVEGRGAARRRRRRQRSGESADRQARRRVERLAHYRDLGIEPGLLAWLRLRRRLASLAKAKPKPRPMPDADDLGGVHIPWYQRLSEWQKAIVGGLAFAVPVTVFCLTLFHFSAR